MAREEVQEWLISRGHMTYPEFVEWVKDLAEDIDADGIPVGLDRGREELRGFLEGLVNEVRTSIEIKEILLPETEVDPGRPFERTSLAWRLGTELRHEYLHREAVIVNTSRQLYNLGETTEYMSMMDIRRLVEKIAVEEGVGV
jgi:hypothetical protein